MTMICKICSHTKRLKIDRDIVQGGNLTKIAKKYGVPYHSLYSHSKEHLSRQLVQAWEKKDLAESMNLMHRIDQIIIRADDIFQRNYDKEKDALALKALGEQRATIDLLGKISAYLHEIRAMELQSQQGDYESRLRTEEKEWTTKVFDRLSEAEVDIYIKLVLKIHGDIDDDIAVYGKPSWEKKPVLIYEEWQPSNPYQPEPDDDELDMAEPEEREPAPVKTKRVRKRRTKSPKKKHRVQPAEPVKLQPYSPRPKRVC
jgi:hypothetical protein